jgi:Ser/Thr protein kinase RdoA (MazF antagonist)
MKFAELSVEEQIDSLTPIAQLALSHYGIESSELENINHEYNSTFAVTSADGARYALRININSGRTVSNIAGETFFIDSLAKAGGFRVALPIANAGGELVTTLYHQASERDLYCVLFNWLEGEDLGDEPTIEQVFEVGKLMAQLHNATAGLELPTNAELPVFDDFMWHVEDLLLGSSSQLSVEEKETTSSGRTAIEKVISELYANNMKQLIHADLHGWNLKWHNNSLSVFDFDDCGIGLPIQDLATAIYYLDTEEQEVALKQGYASVRSLPDFTDYQMKALLLQRRIHLLNYLFETDNPEHRELLPKYQAETMRRIETFLAS